MSWISRCGIRIISRQRHLNSWNPLSAWKQNLQKKVVLNPFSRSNSTFLIFSSGDKKSLTSHQNTPYHKTIISPICTLSGLSKKSSVFSQVFLSSVSSPRSHLLSQMCPTVPPFPVKIVIIHTFYPTWVTFLCEFQYFSPLYPLTPLANLLWLV